MGELLPRLSTLTTAAIKGADQILPEGRILSVVFRLDVCEYAIDSKRRFCALYNSCGGLFLLHFPAGRPGRTLSVILLFDARTFLTVIPYGTIPRDRPTQSGILYTHFSGLSSAECGRMERLATNEVRFFAPFYNNVTKLIKFCQSTCNFSNLCYNV